MTAQQKAAKTCTTAPTGGASARPKRTKTQMNAGAIGSDEHAGQKKFRLVKAAKSREREVERAKSMIYGALPEIIGGVIQEATRGNHNAARFLMQYAGIQGFALPDRAAAQPEAAKEEHKVEPMDPEEAVEHFYKVLGMKVPQLLPPGVKPQDIADDADPNELWRAHVCGHEPPGEFGIAESGT